MTDLEQLQAQAAKLTTHQRACLNAIQGRNFHPCDHNTVTLIVLTDRGLIHQPARGAMWQITDHGRAILHAPLPHVPRLLGNKMGYTDKAWLAIKATDGREPELESVDPEQLNPSWTNDAGARHHQNPQRQVRHIRALRRAA